MDSKEKTNTKEKTGTKKKQNFYCFKCGIELSWKEISLHAGLCFVCNRIENDRQGCRTHDTIRYDDRYFDE